MHFLLFCQAGFYRSSFRLYFVRKECVFPNLHCFHQSDETIFITFKDICVHLYLARVFFFCPDFCLDSCLDPFLPLQGLMKMMIFFLVFWTFFIFWIFFWPSILNGFCHCLGKKNRNTLMVKTLQTLVFRPYAHIRLYPYLLLPENLCLCLCYKVYFQFFCWQTIDIPHQQALCHYIKMQ